MKTEYTFELAEADAMSEEDLEEIASLLASIIYRSTVRKTEKADETIYHTL